MTPDPIRHLGDLLEEWIAFCGDSLPPLDQPTVRWTLLAVRLSAKLEEEAVRQAQSLRFTEGSGR